MPREQTKKNLVPLNKRSKEEQRKIQSAGGKASGAARRRKKSLKEAADLLLSLPADAKKRNAMTKLGIDPDDADNQMAMLVGLMQAGALGDAKAAKLVFDALGEEDKGSGDVVKIIDDIPTPPEEETDGK